MGVRLSLCMIVRDEEDSLPRCLRSIEGIPDETIIVDTGSTDRTREIAREFGATVLEFPWSGSFSEARNHGIDQARGEWILILDADDELAPEDRVKIPGLLDDPEVEGYLFQTINYTGNRPGVLYQSGLNTRMFRNRPENRYQGSIHEQLACRPGSRFVVADIRVYHYGYLVRALEGKKKIERNIRLLREALARDRHELRVQVTLGSEYCNLGLFGKALPLLRKAYARLDLRQAHAPDLVKKLFLTYFRLKRYGEAQSTLEEGIASYPGYTDLYFWRGQLHLELRQYSLALKDFAKCLSLGEPDILFPSDHGVGSYRALEALGLVHEALGNDDLALEHYLQALRLKTSYTLPLYRVAGILQRRPPPGGIAAFFESNFSLDDPVTLLVSIEALTHSGLYEDALGLSRHLKTRQGERPEQAFLLGNCLLGLGRVREALASLERIPGQHPARAQGLIAMSFCYWISGDPESAIRTLSSLPEAWTDRPMVRSMREFGYFLLGKANQPERVPANEAPRSRAGRLEQALLLAEKFLDLKRPDLAEKSISAIYGGLADPGPGARQARLGLGKLFHRFGLLHQSAKLLEEAAEALDSEGACCLGDGLLAEGDLTGAIRTYRRAVAMDPQNLTSYRRLGRALRLAASDQVLPLSSDPRG